MNRTLERASIILRAFQRIANSLPQTIGVGKTRKVHNFEIWIV
jgi:hypothetical protein